MGRVPLPRLSRRQARSISGRNPASRSARYFPEVVAMLGRAQADQFVLDGELAIPLGDTLSFDALQMRIHPAESRIKKLAAETPAILILFDMLLDTQRQQPDRGAADEAPRGARALLQGGAARASD